MKTSSNYWLLIFFLFPAASAKAQRTNNLQLFLAGIDSIRSSLKIPGMAVAVAKDDSIVLEGGLGYADLKHHIPVTPNTTFRIASITKTFTSTIIMQLVEQGKIKLETPIAVYGVDFGNPRITVKNLLTHTSEGEPGSFYQYNGGAKKNQKVESVVMLQPGAYKLKYKSDWAHAYDSWDSLPPDNFIWGITLFLN